jgi:hypothetical protein
MLKNINNVRLWHKADIRRVPVHVRFWGNSGNQRAAIRCLPNDDWRTVTASRFPNRQEPI